MQEIYYDDDDHFMCEEKPLTHLPKVTAGKQSLGFELNLPFPVAEASWSLAGLSEASLLCLPGLMHLSPCFQPGF